MHMSIGPVPGPNSHSASIGLAPSKDHYTISIKQPMWYS